MHILLALSVLIGLSAAREKTIKHRQAYYMLEDLEFFLNSDNRADSTLLRLDTITFVNNGYQSLPDTTFYPFRWKTQCL